MAADPMTLSDSRSMRAGTGIGIALAIAATVGAIAFLAPRLREEMREDIFSPRVAAQVPAPAPMAPAPTQPVAAPQPVALKPAAQIVPDGSLAPGETEIAPAAPVRPTPSHAAKPHRHRTPAAPRKNPIEGQKTARAPAPRLAVDEGFAGRPMAPARRVYRTPEPRRESDRPGRLVGGIHREDPFDYRTWHPHRNPDAPSTSPVERQPG